MLFVLRYVLELRNSDQPHRYGECYLPSLTFIFDDGTGAQDPLAAQVQLQPDVLHQAPVEPHNGRLVQGTSKDKTERLVHLKTFVSKSTFLI